jgi:hypothetical protein
MLRMQDVGELAYGGGVTLAQWWDEKRITAGSLTSKELVKQAGFWTYLGIGIPAALMSAFNWPRGGRYAAWTDRLTHGFLFGLPGFIKSTVTNLSSTTATHTRGDAVAQAQEILRQRQAAARSNQGAAAGKGATGYEVVSPYEILT